MTAPPPAAQTDASPYGLRHYEDFAPGDVFDLGRRTVSRADILAFAEEFDPLPFHLDEAAAEASLLGGLAASGWHTAAVMMRLYVDGLLAQTASMGGAGVERLDWKRPVRPGDVLAGTASVLDMRVSKSRPSMGIIRVRVTLANGAGDVVLDCTTALLCTVREPT